ncbi:MAG: hypothetical protein GKR88_02055 [Flavobacteriaceae bacterium]|nr:MAG: hypothetical protein GKR88_02055 [Flavobacteriaceae bacterium]
MSARKSNFNPVSIEAYIEIHLKNNPSKNKIELQESLTTMLQSYKDGKQCKCGNDIWVIGSAVLLKKTMFHLYYRRGISK